MYGCNNIRNGVLSEMHEKYVDCNKHMQHYKKMYTAEKKRCEELMKIINELKKDISKREQKMSILQRDSLDTSDREVTKKSRKRKQ